MLILTKLPKPAYFVSLCSACLCITITAFAKSETLLSNFYPFLTLMKAILVSIHGRFSHTPPSKPLFLQHENPTCRNRLYFFTNESTIWTASKSNG